MAIYGMLVFCLLALLTSSVLTHFYEKLCDPNNLFGKFTLVIIVYACIQSILDVLCLAINAKKNKAPYTIYQLHQKIQQINPMVSMGLAAQSSLLQDQIITKIPTGEKVHVDRVQDLWSKWPKITHASTNVQRPPFFAIGALAIKGIPLISLMFFIINGIDAVNNIPVLHTICIVNIIWNWAIVFLVFLMTILRSLPPLLHLASVLFSSSNGAAVEVAQ